MQVKALFLGVASCLAFIVQACAAQPESADHWLQRLQAAQGMQGYQGAFVYERKGAFSTHQVSRQVDAEGQVLEHFLQLNGPAHEVLRIDGRVACVSSPVVGELATVDVWPAETVELQGLQQWYQVRVLGESRVAGQPSVVLLFSPRDQYRYPVELTVDHASAVPLKSLLLNEQGQLLERLQFVQFEAIPAQSGQTNLTASSACVAVAPADDNVLSPVDSEWSTQWLPPGFVLLNSQYEQASAADSHVLGQIYSDGLAHFSVFIEPIDGLEIESGRRQLGPTAVVSRKVARSDALFMITVVGEIPLASAERMALSVHAELESTND